MAFMRPALIRVGLIAGGGFVVAALVSIAQPFGSYVHSLGYLTLGLGALLVILGVAGSAGPSSEIALRETAEVARKRLGTSKIVMLAGVADVTVGLIVVLL